MTSLIALVIQVLEKLSRAAALARYNVMNSHPIQSFSLSSCGTISIIRAHVLIKFGSVPAV